MANYKLSPNAKDDLERIWFYGLEQWGQARADQYLQELFEAIGKIADSPYHYKAIDHIRPGYRRCVFKSDTIYFRIGEETVEIIAILGRQDRAKWV